MKNLKGRILILIIDNMLIGIETCVMLQVQMTCQHTSSHLCLAAPSRTIFNYLYFIIFICFVLQIMLLPRISTICPRFMLQYIVGRIDLPPYLYALNLLCRIPISDGKLNMGTWQVFFVSLLQPLVGKVVPYL